MNAIMKPVSSFSARNLKTIFQFFIDFKKKVGEFNKSFIFTTHFKLTNTQV